MHLCYQVKADHRKPKWNSKVKSLWTAIEYHEIDIFSYGLIKSWITETSNKEIVWSFHRDSNENKILKIALIFSISVPFFYFKNSKIPAAP